MKQVLQDLTRLKPTVVLYLGNKDKLKAVSVKSTEGKAGLRLLQMRDAMKVYEWLDYHVGTSSVGGQDYAIIFDNDYLATEATDFLSRLQSNPKLQSMPLFVHVDEYDEVDKEDLLKLGIDDCIKTPLDWQNVEQKIDFWLRYKSDIKQANPSNAEGACSTPKPVIAPLKRAFDLVIATTLLILLSPILLAISILIKIDSKGPVFYKSKRVGAGYQIFDFWKFRSMYQDADERLEKLLHLNQYVGEDCNNCFIKIKNDPRITSIGRFIRKTSLDELPQLFNVLRGEMSLVGNRPLPPYEAIMMVDNYKASRFLAPAGLTGLWQVSKRGKSDMSTEERIDLDVTYAKNHSFLYDMKLLLKTLPAMIQEEDV
ncbi:MAG: sugar transferase [Bacteroidota bacterium]